MHTNEKLYLMLGNYFIYLKLKLQVQNTNIFNKKKIYEHFKKLS